MKYRYIDVIKQFFDFKAYDKKYTSLLLASAILRDLIALLIPLWAAKIIDCATKADYSSALIFVLILGITFLTYTLVWHLNYSMYTKSTNYTYVALQDMVMKKVITFDEDYSKKISKAYLVNTVSSDVARSADLPDILFDAISHFISLIVTVIILCFANIWVGLLALIANILYFTSLNYNSLKREYWMLRQQKCQDRVVGLTGEIIDGTKEVKSFDMNNRLNKHLNVIKKDFKRAYFTKRRYWNRMLAILPIFLFVAKAIAYIILILLIAMGKAEVALLVLVIGYYERIEEENKSLFTKLSQIGARTTKVYRLHQLFNYNPGTTLEYGQNPKDNILGVVDFENVNFSYEKEALIKNINLHIESNSLTAIVGKSGSGKSTLFRLLLRLYKPDSGQITIDGVDIFDFTKDIYSSNVSVATQKPFIFNMSIKENLNMVNKSYTKQIEACKRVGIHDFIMTLPKGYNTILKEDATDISGGQKQLIALARTLLSESEILLFDEITSSLDPNTAKQVVKVLRNLKKDHTVIMITHKPTLMKIADKIVVMDSGRIVGEGKHKTLLEENKCYKRLQK